MSRYVTEFIGTFFLCLTIGLTVTTGHPMAPLAIGGVFVSMVYMGGPVSGAHYNPAVSIAVLLRGAMPARDLLPYFAAQLLGAMAGAVVTGVILSDLVTPSLSPDTTTGIALTVELLFTFALALVVLNVATSARTQGNSYFGLAIGFTIMVGAWAAGGISGGALNPAVGIGMGLVDGLLGGAPMNHLWVYFVGPVAGAVLAALVFKLQEPSGPNG